MSDNLGPNQTRVLDSTSANFESVVYQKRKPPLSSETNLGGGISAGREQQNLQALVPSGWLSVGQIIDGVTQNTCKTGDVFCSSSLVRNTFRLIALDKGQDARRNIAIVNGWRVLVQGTNSADENNTIILPNPPTTASRVDFVFLEVWRKLVYPSDPVFEHGNFLYGGHNPDNDLIDPSMGIETSLRVQLQYRIRVAPCDIESYPDGFDPVQVNVQGPLAAPISTCSQAYFSPIPGDIGLWRAGAGDSVAQETLQTVDGYTYAIPMFAIRRRNSSSYDPQTRANGAEKTLADYLAGYPSDRPDNFYSDWIVAEDIMDMRSRVAGGVDFKQVCEDGFRKLLNNQNRGKMVKSALGGDHYGTTMVAADAISNNDLAGSTKIGQGGGIVGSLTGVRRVYSNAKADQPECFTKIGRAHV